MIIILLLYFIFIKIYDFYINKKKYFVIVILKGPNVYINQNKDTEYIISLVEDMMMNLLYLVG